MDDWKIRDDASDKLSKETIALLLRIQGYTVEANYAYHPSYDPNTTYTLDFLCLGKGKKIAVKHEARSMPDKYIIERFISELKYTNFDDAWIIAPFFNKEAQDILSQSTVKPLSYEDLAKMAKEIPLEKIDLIHISEELSRISKAFESKNSNAIIPQVVEPSSTVPLPAEEVIESNKTVLTKIPGYLSTYYSRADKKIHVIIISENEVEAGLVPDKLDTYEVVAEQVTGSALSLLKQNIVSNMMNSEYSSETSKEGLFVRDSYFLNLRKIEQDAAQFLQSDVNRFTFKSKIITDGELQNASNIYYTTLDAIVSQIQELKQNAKRQVDDSVNLMSHAFTISITLHNLMFVSGIALILSGIVAAFFGITIGSITLGGVGVLNLIFYLIKEPVEGIHEDTGNLLQLRAAYNSFSAMINQWRVPDDGGLFGNYDKNHTKRARDISNKINEHTKDTLELIQTYSKVDNSKTEKEGTLSWLKTALTKKK